MFTEPYTNFHELNLDWILARVKEWFSKAENWDEWQQNVQKGFDDLKKFVADYFDNLDVQDEINNKLDEMAEDGTLADIINQEIFGEIQDKLDELEYFQRTYLNWSGWRTFISQDGYLSAGVGLTLTVTEANQYLSSDPNRYSEFFYIATPTPVNYMNVVGSCDVDGGWVSNVDNYKNIGVKFRVWFPYDYSGSLPKTVTVRLLLTTVIREPEDLPENVSYNAAASQSLVDIAKSYVTARENGRVFEYGRNFFYTSAPANIINDSQGRGKMECDTFVGLCLRGIPYNKSPYINTTPDFTYEYNELYTDVSGATAWAPSTAYTVGDLVSTTGELSEYWECVYPHTSGADFNSTYWKSIWIINPNNLGWSSTVNAGLHPANVYLNRDIKYAGDLAFWAWSLNDRTDPDNPVIRVFKNAAESKTGDLCFWIRRSHKPTYWGGYSESPAFDNCGHVAILSIEDGERYIYQVTSAAASGGRVVERRLLSELSEQPDYYGRVL